VRKRKVPFSGPPEIKAGSRENSNVALFRASIKGGQLKWKYVSCFQRKPSSVPSFHNLLKENTTFLFMLGWSFISVISLMILSMCLKFLARILMSLSKIQQPRQMFCSAMANFSR
jgi:hypothetical protein